MAGNTLSYLYSVEWPAFVVVAGIGWWQMFHDTPEDIAARKAHHARARAASAEVVARTLPRSALAITVESDETGERQPSIRIGAGAAPRVRRARACRPPEPAPGPTGCRRCLSMAGLLSDEDAARRRAHAYNRYLALLAVKGKAKTWRNPHGV